MSWASRIYSREILDSAYTQATQEYMNWRIRRNQQRLRILGQHASTIQKGWRAYMARTMVYRMKLERAAIMVQVKI